MDDICLGKKQVLDFSKLLKYVNYRSGLIFVRGCKKIKKEYYRILY